ncbi:hypothetical protein F2Q70_00020125 [Brassica cretica]|uniref:Kinesin motor domain-containing protein n=1 Tax=Brassica cretica TaxID=69181 RepID=A0A8S9GU45_BRACR|nr:hypothetical protein F2Q70_00020125 [Brassica cretica]
MACSSVFITVLISLVPVFLQPGLAQGQSPPASCASLLLALAPCGPFVQGFVQFPAQPCCSSLSQIYSQQPTCLCLFLNNNSTLSSAFPINQTLALQLPQLCSVPANSSVCSSGASTASPPSTNSTGSQVSMGAKNNSVAAAEVFSDIKPLVRSVLDGYNVCIFAYGQTGSGKTYTMTGPDGASEEEWGVNYRALNDLFKISQSRKSNIAYEVGVQMVEIYNEQMSSYFVLVCKSFVLLDFHTLGILSTAQQNGLAVPDASMYPVTSTSDVLELMNIGLDNRVVSSTALNERSSRSHSIVTVHVRGKDLKTGSALYGNLHLVDLAGSERVDRSEVTGDRLKEAQHINKSLSALGDVIFSLASKNSHVPYRNSKLTQLLQSSLGGRAKTLMFVQLNPDVISYSESMSTLKFAERVSGVELGAAKSSKDGRDVRDLMEQLGSLKDTIARKDDEIERLHLLKDINYPQRLQRKSLGHSDEFNSEESQLSIEEDSRSQQDHLRQSRHSIIDREALASSIDSDCNLPLPLYRIAMCMCDYAYLAV